MFENGVWRTIGGRRVFIKDGEDLKTAMKKSGKFKKEEIKDKKDDKKEIKSEEKKINYSKDEIKDAVEDYTASSYDKIRKASMGEKITYIESIKWENGVPVGRLETPKEIDVTNVYKNKANAIEQAINESKGYNKELYRGVNMSKEDVEKYKIGDTINQKGISSWSKNQKTAENYSEKGRGEKKVVFIQKDGAKKALDVSNISSAKNFGEDEILQSKNNNQKIINIKEEKGKIYIYVKDI